MKMLIAGEQVDSESGQTTEVRNPATGELVDSVPKGTINDIRRAIDAAQGALKKWSTMAPSKRGAVLLAAGHTILQQEKELATLLTKEQGKPMRESILEIRRFVHTLDHYGAWQKPCAPARSCSTPGDMVLSCVNRSGFADPSSRGIFRFR